MSIKKIINANLLNVEDGSVQLATLEIKDGRITTISEQEDMVNEDADLDLAGDYLSPGFIDTHSHLIMYSNFRRQLNCSPENTKSIEEIIEKFKAQKDELLRDGWLRGYGYNEYELKEGRHPNRFDLDKVSTEIPIYIQHSSAHMGTVNTKALELMNLDLDAEDPKGGSFERDENGQINGVLFEFPALDKVKAVLPDISKEDLAEDIKGGVYDYQSRGITSATEMCVGLLNGINDYKASLKYLADKVEQDFRIRFAIDYKLLLNDPIFKGETAQSIREKLENLSDGFSTLAGAKFFNDGSIQLKTASLRAPYYDGTPSADTQFTLEELEELYIHFQKLGYTLITHANGDKAGEDVIKAYINTSEYKETSDMHRVEHLQVASLEDIKQMTEHNIGGSFFITHIYYFGDVHKNIFLGPKRVINQEPVRWAEDEGMIFTIHSDCPVTDISPLDSIRFAVERKTRKGDTLGDVQKLSRVEAYKKMTIDAARLNKTDHVEGSIKEGKYADFVVLRQNPYDDSTILSDELVLQTIVNGKTVYKK